ncbi:response regulator transcription factor [Luteirhabdus pelagi]|uniref:response regulator transcription factor n=1 Tax=Luteirhabdus pelagi TaxID=2792783 RepID=UPI001939A304|nr:LuxR C-terminal-related transcriptional regulator [Luteirhabdus pelagi]
MKKTIFVFGILIIALLSLFQLSSYSIMAGDLSSEVFIAITAIIFLILGFWLQKRRKERTIQPKPAPIDSEKISELGITDREHEILVKLSEGLSNKEIGETLFISESTVKTHLSNLYSKLNVKRRTQALQQAKKLHIL